MRESKKKKKRGKRILRKIIDANLLLPFRYMSTIEMNSRKITEMKVSYLLIDPAVKLIFYNHLNFVFAYR